MKAFSCWSVSALAGCAMLASAAPALAHVSLESPAFAGARKVLTFSVGHGCAGADTVGVRVNIPPEVTALRAVPGPFGEAVVTTSSAGVPLAVEWTKAVARGADDQFYQFQLRITVPNLPFTKIYFKTIQTCRATTGEMTTTEWVALPGEEGEPSPELTILPARRPGWNKLSVPIQLDELTVFDDAEIVWSGNAAYSSNPATMEMITAEPGVEVLTTVPAASEIWVKY